MAIVRPRSDRAKASSPISQTTSSSSVETGRAQVVQTCRRAGRWGIQRSAAADPARSACPRAARIRPFPTPGADRSIINVGLTGHSARMVSLQCPCSPRRRAPGPRRPRNGPRSARRPVAARSVPAPAGPPARFDCPADRDDATISGTGRGERGRGPRGAPGPARSQPPRSIATPRDERNRIPTSTPMVTDEAHRGTSGPRRTTPSRGVRKTTRAGGLCRAVCLSKAGPLTRPPGTLSRRERVRSEPSRGDCHPSPLGEHVPRGHARGPTMSEAKTGERGDPPPEHGPDRRRHSKDARSAPIGEGRGEGHPQAEAAPSQDRQDLVRKPRPEHDASLGP